MVVDPDTLIPDVWAEAVLRQNLTKAGTWERFVSEEARAAALDRARKRAAYLRTPRGRIETKLHIHRSRVSDAIAVLRGQVTVDEGSDW